MARVKGRPAGSSLNSNPLNGGTRNGVNNGLPPGQGNGDNLIRFGTDPFHLSYGQGVHKHPGGTGYGSGWYGPGYGGYGNRGHYPYHGHGHGHHGHGYYGYRPHCYPHSAYPYYGFYPWYGYGYGLGFGFGYTYSSAYLADPYVSYVYTEPEYVTSYPATEYSYPATEYVEYAAPTVQVAPTIVEPVPIQQTQPAQPAPPPVPAGESAGAPQTFQASENQIAVVMEGNSAFTAGRFEDARAAYAKAVMNDDRDGYAKVLYGWSNFAIGNYEVAAASIRQALMTTPDLVNYPQDLRTLYSDQAVLDRQSEGLLRFLSDNPSHSEGRFLWGYLLYSIGQAESASVTFRSMTDANPSDALMSSLRDAAVRNSRAQPSAAPKP